MAIQVRRGNEVDFDPSKMLPGEWAVSLDTRYVRMCFSPGICLRMATYEAFEADMAEIQSIVAEARTIQEAVERIQTEINDTAIVVEDYAILSKSYAVGGTGTREGEDVDNAKYYYEQAKYISQGGNGLVPLGSIAFENLPTEDIITNAMYNISNDFTSDERFLDGGGILYGKGSNVFYTADGKWDVLAASDVKGVKGEAEDTYRQGNVTITKANLGMGDYGTADISKIADGTVKGGLSAVNENLGAIATNYVKRHGNFGYTYEMARGNHDFLTTNDFGNLPSIPEISNYIYIIGKSAEGIVTGALAIGDDYSNRVYRYSAKDNAWESLVLNSDLEGMRKITFSNFEKTYSVTSTENIKGTVIVASENCVVTISVTQAFANAKPKSTALYAKSADGTNKYRYVNGIDSATLLVPLSKGDYVELYASSESSGSNMFKGYVQIVYTD